MGGLSKNLVKRWAYQFFDLQLVACFHSSAISLSQIEFSLPKMFKQILQLYSLMSETNYILPLFLA